MELYRHDEEVEMRNFTRCGGKRFFGGGSVTYFLMYVSESPEQFEMAEFPRMTNHVKTAIDHNLFGECLTESVEIR